MSLVLKDPSVLKLVYPGGLVEIHLLPITADEVMKKNPKHCVARPDVFKCPWIVVRPESVLKPGNIFYIVPHHTMRKLMLKAQEKESEQGKIMTKHSKDNISIDITDKKNQEESISKHGTRNGYKNSRVACDNQSAIEYSSVDLSYFNSIKEMTPSHHDDKMKNNLNTDICGSKAPVRSRSDFRNPCEHSTFRKERYQQATTPKNLIKPRNNAEFQRMGSPDELLEKEITSQKHPQKIAERVPDQLKILEKSVNSETEIKQQSNNVNTVDISEKLTSLKSCLKGLQTTNSTSNLRVRFMLPGDDDRIMRTRLWLSGISPVTP